MAKLESIELNGWKSIKRARLEFGSINVLIGANGSGKSNLISFFRLLTELVQEKLREYIVRSGGADSLLYYGAKETQEITAELRFESDEKEYAYQCRLTHGGPGFLHLTGEQMAADKIGTGGPRWLTLPIAASKEVGLKEFARRGNAGAERLLAFINGCRVYHLHDTSREAAVRRPVYVEDNGSLKPDAGNLAAVLFRIKFQDPPAYQRIVGTIRQINPRFDDFSLEPSQTDTKTILLNWHEQGRDVLFGPHQLSDGTLRAMAIVTLLLQPTNSLPDVIVIDEPEMGLHPYALAVIAGLLRMVSHHCQVIISTQSVELLNHFGVEDVIVVDRRSEATEFKRLKEDELREWLENYSIGELWEKNVIGGGPH